MLPLVQAVKAQAGVTISRARGSRIGAIVITGESIRGVVNAPPVWERHGGQEQQEGFSEVSTLSLKVVTTRKLA